MKNNTVAELTKIFNSKLDWETKDKIPEEKRLMYMSNDAIIGIVPKNKQFQDLITGSFSFSETEIVKPINPDYTKGLNECIISTEYLTMILNICKQYNEIKITTGKELPLLIETPDFSVYIAGKVEQ